MRIHGTFRILMTLLAVITCCGQAYSQGNPYFDSVNVGGGDTGFGGGFSFGGISLEEDGDVKIAGDLTVTGGGPSSVADLLVNGTLTLSPGSEDFEFTSGGTGLLSVANTSAGTNMVFEIFTNDGDLTDSASLKVWAEGSVASRADSSFLFLGYNAATSRYEIGEIVAGSGTELPIAINMTSNPDQLVLLTNGDIGIGTASAARRLEVRGTEQIVAAFHTTHSTLGAISLSDAETASDGTVRIQAKDDDLSLVSGGTEGALLDSSGNFSISLGDLWMLKATSPAIHPNTSDGSDDSSISIFGGGATGSGRGASLLLLGNEAPAVSGEVFLSSGEGADMTLSTDGSTRLTIDGTSGLVTILESLVVDGLTIGITADPDLMTMAADLLTVNGDGVYTIDLEVQGGIITGAASLRLQETTAASQFLIQSTTYAFRRDAVASNIVVFQADDSGGAATVYGKLTVAVIDSTDGTEDGRIAFGVMQNGTVNENVLKLFNNGNVEIQDDLLFSSGGGLLYGGISVKDNATATVISGTGEGNKVQFVLFDTNDVSNNTTPDHTNDHITIGTTGDYEVNASIHIDSVAGLSEKFGFAVYRNNGATQLPNVHAHQDVPPGAGGNADSVHISGQVTLTAADTIELWVWTENGTQNIVIADATLHLHSLGVQ